MDDHELTPDLYCLYKLWYDNIIANVKKDDILAGADKLHADLATRGVLHAFPHYGGVAGAYLHLCLKEHAPFCDPVKADEWIKKLIDHYGIASNYIPMGALIKEALTLILHLREVLEKISPNGCPHVTKSNLTWLIRRWLEDEADGLDKDWTLGADIPKEKLEALIEAFKSLPGLCVPCDIERHA